MKAISQPPDHDSQQEGLSLLVALQSRGVSPCQAHSVGRPMAIYSLPPTAMLSAWPYLPIQVPRVVPARMPSVQTARGPRTIIVLVEQDRA